MATLGELLDEERLALFPVVDRRRDDQVRWVATSELADPAPFLEGGEVLLTTGLETGGWTREWDGYVRRLAKAGVVAIGFGLELTHPHSPAPLVRACRKHHVDLFEIPRGTTFVAVSRRIADLLQREHETAEGTALVAQRALVQAALREDPGALLAEVASIGVMAALVGTDGTIVAGPRGDRPDVLDADAVAAAVVRMRPRGLRAAASLSTETGTLLVHPLGVRGRPSRYLVTGFDARVSDLQRSTVATAVALLSLAEARDAGRRETDRRLRGRAVELLVGGDLRTPVVLLGAGSGPRLRLPRTAVVLRGRGTRAALDDGIEVAESAGVLAGQVTRDGRPELVAVVAAGEARRLAGRLSDAGLLVGIGRPGRPGDLPASDETAGHALEQATATSPVASWEDAVQHGVLALLDGARAAAFAASYLAPLEEHDDPALVETLAAYLRHGGSLLKIAEDLGVHRNTVRNRVERIEGLLGRSLAEPQVRTDAWVALQARALRR